MSPDTVIARFEQTIRQIKYKPGFTIRLCRGREEDVWLQVQYEEHPAAPSIRGRKWRLSLFATDTEIVQTALKAVLTFEEHETREAFRYKEQAIYSPHYDVETLVHVCRMGHNNDARKEPA